ncbi:MAG: HAD-IA family hydrolase [Pseudomonadota bacterium]
MKLVLFDMDGTLIDSQAHIVASMQGAYAAVGVPAPTRDDILSIVGLSLPQAMFRLAPDQPADVRDHMVQAYKDSFMALRAQGHQSPLYDGALACLTMLQAMPDVVLGVATGKSLRGVDAVFAQHDLAPYFATVQVADDHPSKPHPSMVHRALLETEADTCVMVGDTTYDMDMGRAAGVQTLAVTWGYHSAAQLRPCADVLCTTYSDMVPILKQMGAI